MPSYSLFLAVAMNSQIQNCVVYAEDPDTTGHACVEQVARAALDKIITGDHPAYLRMVVPSPDQYDRTFADLVDAASGLIDERKAEIFD